MKTFVLILCLGTLSLNLSAQQPLFVNQPKDSVVRLDPRQQQFDFVPGEILIKYKDEVQVTNLKVLGIVQTGLSSIDSVFIRHKVSNAGRLFPKEQQLKSKTMLRGFNGQEFEQPSLHNIYKLTLPQESNLFQAIEELKKDSNVVYAEPNYILSITNDKAVSPILTEKDLLNSPLSIVNCPLSIPANPLSAPANSAPPKSPPNDPLYPQQWYIPAVHADEVWDTVNGKDTTQVICVLDTGVDWLHPDLQNKIWINPGEIPGNGIDDDGNGYVDDVRGWDWINNDNNPMDDNSHGTHVAGIAAAEANNGIGISGVCHGAKIMALKVFQSSGRGDVATITQGINYAKNKGATVINMSFGSYARSLTMEAALANAYSTCVLVAAAGNDNNFIGPQLDCAHQPGTPFFPAALSFVLGTQAPSGCGWGFSNYDNNPVYSDYADLLNYEMKAPGNDILSTIPNGNYRVYEGTSMAAPVISASVAVYKSLFTNDSQELLWVKFIQSTSIYLNILQAIRCVPSPQLWFISNTIVDTLTGGDRDGRVDAGESIQLWFKVRNTGGQADSVRIGIRFREFEDTTTAQILTSQVYVGDIGAYATSTNQWIPLKIHINPNVANDRDIVFQAFSWYKDAPDSTFQNITLTVENGQELQGMLGDTLVLTAEKSWHVTGSFKITPTGVLIIEAGTHLEIKSKIVNDGKIIAIGKPDSLINIEGTRILGGEYAGFLDLNYVDLNLNYYEPPTGAIEKQILLIKKSKITLNGWYGVYNCTGEISESILSNWMVSRIYFQMNNDLAIKNCNILNMPQNIASTNGMFFENNNFNNTGTFMTSFTNVVSFTMPNNIISLRGSQALVANTGYFQYETGQYWGTSDSIKIENKIYDFMEDASLSRVIFSPYLKQPFDSCHGLVWKILVNSKDAQDEYVDPVGMGSQRFNVFFNREMDTTFKPQLNFGIRYPYIQQSITDSGRWDSTHRIWTAYKNIQLYTGDGINRLRVSGAKDLEGWEIPIEDQRFEFLINAAGSASTSFIAQAGIGKVYLEWNNSGIADLLGFNMYRFKNITDTTYSIPVMINTSLITDTTYTDFAVNPGEHYWYYYKVVNTDFRESDSSNFVNAIPYNAAMGDANGDESVNVLDITALIAFMLGQNPQPFLFDAADVNDDNAINILDVIGVVNIITGKMKSISTTIETNPVAAQIKLEEDRIVLQSEGQIASMQFELAGEALENIKLSEPPAGFELAYGIVKGKLLGILYTSSNKNLPEGSIPMVKISGTKSSLEWGAILAGDNQGRIVPVLKEAPAEQPKEQLFLQAYPNPFYQSVTINFSLPEEAQTMIKIFNLRGRLVNVLTNKELQEGMHWIDWNGASLSNRPLPSGIYICKLEAKTKAGETFNKEIKVIYVK
ncbi:MAG: S8 family serine peptidase [Bacteroidota bacterium]